MVTVCYLVIGCASCVLQSINTDTLIFCASTIHNCESEYENASRIFDYISSLCQCLKITAQFERSLVNIYHCINEKNLLVLRWSMILCNDQHYIIHLQRYSEISHVVLSQVYIEQCAENCWLIPWFKNETISDFRLNLSLPYMLGRHNICNIINSNGC